MSESTLGKIHVYTGNGKGKTTASLGLAIRAAGAGRGVAMIFFDKGGYEYSERKILDKLKDVLEYHVIGRNRRSADKQSFDFSVTEYDIREMKKGLELARKIAHDGKHEVLVLDEINTSMSLGMLEVKEVLDFLRNKPFHLEVILTGRDCPDAIIQQADLVTEMKEVRHYFEGGTPARVGIDY